METRRKKILFLIGNLESGGVSKSMVSLLNVIDKKSYDISLWCASPSGVFYSLLPKDIRIISNKKTTLLLQGINGLFALLKSGDILLFFASIIRLLLSKISKGYAAWWLSRFFLPLNETYDLIVDYNGQQQLYYMVDRLKGKKKVTFFHSDYAKWPYYYKMDRKYFTKVDYIFTISEQCADSLKKFFPKETDKIKLMENISSVDLIRKMADEENIKFSSKISILTVGHVCRSKGTDLAIEAMRLLKDKGIDFKWYFLGEIKEDFSILISKYSLEAYIEFLGIKANPYPYLKASTIYVHPSRFEGKSIALDEAKILCKPIVVTNFSTVHDQFEDGENALITDFLPENIAFKIMNLLDDEELSDSLVENLKRSVSDNSSEINKLYSLL